MKIRATVGVTVVATAMALGSACSATNETGRQESEQREDGFDPGDDSACAAAASARSYVGCDFWPTVTANDVWSVFDFAVVVANAGPEASTVKVERGGVVVATARVEPSSLATLYLPWVRELKGEAESGPCYEAVPRTTAVVPGGAYHLTTDRPVTVYQFNALQYIGAGGPAGKDWSSCPGNQACAEIGGPIGCYSFTNDASLLLPATALTGSYRVSGAATPDWDVTGGFLAITGVHDGTHVTVRLAARASTFQGGGLPGAAPGTSLDLDLDAGDVVQLLGTVASDFGGSLVEASAPVQVISGVPCLNVPFDAPACDHVEESVLPAETLGRHYVVTRPSGPNGNLEGHVVRIVGNFDGTTLTYPAGKPLGAPDTIDAGAVVDLGVVKQDFEVEGSQPFAVSSFLLGGSIVDAAAALGTQKGDPSQSLVVAVEQYRTDYVFLAPPDYDVAWVDIVQPLGASITLDGEPVTVDVAPLGSGGLGIARLKLDAGSGGAHVLTSTEPVGIQVAGYGAYTSYYYPGGLDLEAIAPPPLE
jgi:IgGFc binding protein